MKKGNFFWPSYTDLMTSLFFVMLVLFVLVFMLLRKQNRKLSLEAREFQKIQALNQAVQKLAKHDTLFRYDSLYNRYLLTDEVKFPSGVHEISPKDFPMLKKVGNIIKEEVLVPQGDPSQRDLRFLVIIEGMASKRGYLTEFQNYGLSFNRAYSLYDFWRKEGIFDGENNGGNSVEVLVAGSGTRGVGRIEVKEREEENQRFLIQIIPKVSAGRD